MLEGREHRIRRAAGRGYPDLVRLRSGRLEDAPDAVVLPGSAAEVERVLEICSREGIAVVPFGGGTSVVGGVEPLRGGFERLVSLDLRRLREVVVDRALVDGGAGPGASRPRSRGGPQRAGGDAGALPAVVRVRDDRRLRRHPLRRAGVERLWPLRRRWSPRSASPRRRAICERSRSPHSAAGPALRELVIGSEGALGVITRVTARVRPLPERRRYEAWMAADFASGAEVVRALAQADALPDVVRVSDQTETRFSLALSGAAGAKRALLSSYLRLRRRAGGCLIICGWEGEREAVERRRALSARVLRSGGRRCPGRRAGPSLGAGALRGPVPARRAARPRLPGRDARDRPHLESPRAPLRGGPCGDRRRARRPGHTRGSSSAISRTPTGTAPRCTSPSWLAAGRVTEIEQWRVVKAAACEAIVEAGGTITHHHAVGRDHAPYMRRRGGGAGDRGPSSGQGAARSCRDHEPRQAVPRTRSDSRGAGRYRQGFQGLALSEKSAAFLIELVPSAAALSQNRRAGSRTRPGTRPCPPA